MPGSDVANMSSQYVFAFVPGEADGAAEDREALGGKGANLAEMCRLGLPVPPGFTISTPVCNHFSAHAGGYPDGVSEQVDAALERIGKHLGKRFGAVDDPLLVSVRSGARSSMPGMMETVLNVGLTSETLPGLIAATGDARFVWDTYRRLVMMYADVVMEKATGVEPEDGAGIRQRLERRFDRLRDSVGAERDADLDAEHLENFCREAKDLVHGVLGHPFPDNPREQLWGAISAVFRSWDGKRAVQYRRIENIPDQWGTAVNVQAMVFGNLGADEKGRSATGVAFTRNPATGDPRLYGEWLPDAQGEDVVSGIRTPYALDDASRTDANRGLPTLSEVLPAAHAELQRIRGVLERRYRDMQDVEFTVERGKLWMLQTRAGKRNGPAAVRMAVDMVAEGLIDKAEAVRRVEPAQLDQLLHPRLDPAANYGEPLARGLPAGPGGAVGRVVLTAEAAEKRSTEGWKTVLVRHETSPEDIHGMHVAEAIVTARGGMTSHAALVARGWGKTCVVGCGALDIDPGEGEVRVGDTVLREGDVLTVDGTTGRLWARELPLMDVDPAKDSEVSTLLSWCDELRRLGVRANADRPEDATRAREFGAEGIGLCRTEHMFFGEERIRPMREMILSTTPGERENAVAKLLPYQKEDFRGILRAMEGLPVIIRLLDPPLHEFLPHAEEQITAVATALGVPRSSVRARIDELREQNPMLGHRGCRLGISYPEITRMQAQAILEAAAELLVAGVDARPEIMIPLVGHVAELRDQKRVVLEAAERVREQYPDVEVPVIVGTMIEVPRAALTAGEIAGEAAFFSFGTNDLTQMTCGFSRDDVAGFLSQYVERGIYAADPFQRLDQDGVGQLVAYAVREGRKGKQGLEVGVCGEHGGDPDSIAFCHRVGLDYVSCSPFRVPIARLAAARAALV
ncbi:MAG: pyruvate, phosphate dikinase [Thermoanaerobaculia bacterium]|nr:pyruvate, phosphate dikinase [Thermoanaerobaculia bacterium]